MQRFYYYAVTNYSLLTTILSVAMALCIGWIIVSLKNIIYPPPPKQVDSTIDMLNVYRTESSLIGRNQMKGVRSKDPKVQKQMQREENRESFAIWVATSYKRLGENKDVRDLKRKSNGYKTLFVFFGVLISGLCLCTFNPSMIFAAAAFLVAGLGMTQQADTIAIYTLKQRIKKLNGEQIRELPLLLERFKAVSGNTTIYTIDKVMRGYEPYAQALKYDIQIFRAEAQAMGETEALSSWQTRIADRSGSQMLIFSEGLDAIKNLYQEVRTSNQKENKGQAVQHFIDLVTRIEDRHVTPYIKLMRRKKVKKVMYLIVGIFAVVIAVFAMPMLLRVADDMKAIEAGK